MASPELPFATWRIRKIPSSLDVDKLPGIVPLGDGETVLYSSLAPDHYSDGSKQIGTITWNSLPEHLQQASSVDRLPISLSLDDHPLTDDRSDTLSEQNQVIADSKFLGLTPLNSVPKSSQNI